MLQETKKEEQKARRATRSVVLGVFGLLIGLGLGYVALTQYTPQLSSTYSYEIAQQVNTDVAYTDSSFFDDGPTGDDTAYLADLTDSVNAHFTYDYTANESEDLTYTYSLVATIRSTYGIEGNKDVSNVWTKHLTLKQPVTRTIHSDTVALDETVSIPYQEYQQLADQIRTGLALPVTNEAYVDMLVTVKGDFNGTPFTNTQKARVTVPLNVQIYQPSVAYEKEVSQEVQGAAVAPSTDRFIRYALLAGAALFVVSGLAGILFGLRTHLFKTSYQRELERIYRYHDGLIIRAGRPVKFAGKSVVIVDSFDDILNLEEELKAPIISSPIDTQSTKFMITAGDVVYVYVLGKPISADEDDLIDVINAAHATPVRIASTRKSSPAVRRRRID